MRRLRKLIRHSDCKRYTSSQRLPRQPGAAIHVIQMKVCAEIRLFRHSHAAGQDVCLPLGHAADPLGIVVSGRHQRTAVDDEQEPVDHRMEKNQMAVDNGIDERIACCRKSFGQRMRAATGKQGCVSFRIALEGGKIAFIDEDPFGAAPCVRVLTLALARIAVDEITHRVMPAQSVSGDRIWNKNLGTCQGFPRKLTGEQDQYSAKT